MVGSFPSQWSSIKSNLILTVFEGVADDDKNALVGRCKFFVLVIYCFLEQVTNILTFYTMDYNSMHIIFKLKFIS